MSGAEQTFRDGYPCRRPCASGSPTGHQMRCFPPACDRNPEPEFRVGRSVSSICKSAIYRISIVSKWISIVSK